MGISSQRSLGGEYSAAAQSSRLTEDELFTLLSNQRRRHILHALIHDRSALEVGTLAERIAAWEDGVDVSAISSKDRKRVYTALQQSHLPKMDRMGVIDFDSDRGVVRATPALEDVDIYLDVVYGREIPWSDYYLGLTTLIALVLGGTTLGLAPFTLLPTGAWMAFVVVTLGVSAVAHRYYSRKNRLGVDAEPTDFGLTKTDTEGR